MAAYVILSKFSPEAFRDQVRQLRDVRARQKRLENTLIQAYRRLPKANHLDTIPGIGEVTAAILTAVILDINGYFVPASDPTALAFYPVTPCRIADTRGPAAQLAGPLGAKPRLSGRTTKVGRFCWRLPRP